MLEQPHTSAGRVPTAAAFRYYVEQITQQGTQFGRMGGAGQAAGLGAMAPGASSLSEQKRGQIEDSFSGVSSSNEYLERTSHVLALISSGLGVALASATAGQVLEHIHFSRLSQGRVLAVLVTQAGAVQDRVLTLDRDLTHMELETAARYLNENFRGWPSSGFGPRWRGAWMWSARPTSRCWLRLRSFAARARWPAERPGRRSLWTEWPT